MKKTCFLLILFLMLKVTVIYHQVGLYAYPLMNEVRVFYISEKFNLTSLSSAICELGVLSRKDQATTLESSDRSTAILIKANTLPEDADIRIEKIDFEDPLVKEADKKLKEKIISINIYKYKASTYLGESIQYVNESFTIILRFQDKDNDDYLDDTSIHERFLVIYQLDESAKKWVQLKDYTLDPKENVLRAKTARFGLLKFGAKIVSELLVYPNPFDPFSEEKLYIEPIKDYESLIKIYDLTGRLIRTLKKTEKEILNKKAIWDGKNEEGKFVACGIYFIVIEPSQRSGKIILIRKKP